MIRGRLVLHATALALVLSAVTAASAFAALPEWYKGGSPLAAGHKISISHHATKGEPYLEGTNGQVVKCSGMSASGEIEGPKSVKKVAVVYSGCSKTKATTGTCTTSGKATGEIETKKVEGTLIYPTATTSPAGILFKPETAGSTVFAEFACAGTSGTFKVEGEVIGKAEPTNKEETSGSLVFEQNKGVQKYRQENGAGAKKHLTAFGSEAGIGAGELGEPLTEELTFGEAVELRA